MFDVGTLEMTANEVRLELARAGFFAWTTYDEATSAVIVCDLQTKRTLVNVEISEDGYVVAISGPDAGPVYWKDALLVLQHLPKTILGSGIASTEKLFYNRVRKKEVKKNVKHKRTRPAKTSLLGSDESDHTDHLPEGFW